MNERQQILAKRLLSYLKSLDGGVSYEPQMHAYVGLNQNPRVTLSEFEDLRDLCEAKHWTISATAANGQNTWGISNAGKVALKEL